MHILSSIDTDVMRVDTYLYMYTGVCLCAYVYIYIFIYLFKRVQDEKACTT